MEDSLARVTPPAEMIDGIFKLYPQRPRHSFCVAGPILNVKCLDLTPSSSEPLTWKAFVCAIEATQRADITPPHAEGDGLSGVTRDGVLSGVSSGPAPFAGGVPLTRAMIPWAMPEAST
jgi:hypothetical protein